MEEKRHERKQLRDTSLEGKKASWLGKETRRKRS